MKRTGQIFETLISTENLARAHYAARIGKRHYQEVKAFEKDLPGNIARLQAKLAAGKWDVFGYRQFRTFDGKKMRLIDWDPCHADNVVQHAIEQTAGRVLLAAGISDTYAGIRRRGVHRGVKRIRKFLDEYSDMQPIFVLKIDIRKFYQSVNTEILKIKIRHKIKDRKVLDLFDKIIDSHPDGLPIGNYLSQLMANYYLADFDHWIKNQGIRHCARYCDDVVVIHSDKNKLRDLLSAMTGKLEEMKLTIKPNAQIFPIERGGIDFIGYVFHRHRIRLRKSIERRFRRAALFFQQDKSESALRKLSAYFGWLKWLSHGERLWFSLFDKDLKSLHKEIAK